VNLIILLQTSLPFLLLVTAVIGLMVGSFLNVVVYRLPVMMERDWHRQCADLKGEETADAQPPFNLATPRSRCPHCGHAISAVENIPVLSYLFLRGRCKGCGAAIALRYPVVEAATALLSLAVVWHFGFTYQAGAALVFTWAMIAASLIDYDHQLLPDSITLPLLWLGLLLSLFGVFTDSTSSIVGAAVGYLALWSVYWLFKLLTGREGMGYGDFKLLGMLGAWMGWQSLPAIILLSSFVGAVVGVALMLLKGRDRHYAIPFGPYLAAAGWIALLWGPSLNRLYLTWAMH